MQYRIIDQHERTDWNGINIPDGHPRTSLAVELAEIFDKQRDCRNAQQGTPIDVEFKFGGDELLTYRVKTSVIPHYQHGMVFDPRVLP